MKKKLISRWKLINLSLSSTIFHKVFHEYLQNRIRTEEREANVQLDSVGGLVGDFFSKLASKIRKIIQGKNEKNNKGIKFLKIIDNFFN